MGPSSIAHLDRRCRMISAAFCSRFFALCLSYLPFQCTQEGIEVVVDEAYPLPVLATRML